MERQEAKRVLNELKSVIAVRGKGVAGRVEKSIILSQKAGHLNFIHSSQRLYGSSIIFGVNNI